MTHKLTLTFSPCLLYRTHVMSHMYPAGGQAALAVNSVGYAVFAQTYRCSMRCAL